TMEAKLESLRPPTRRHRGLDGHQMGSDCALRLEILMAMAAIVRYGNWQQTEVNFILCFPDGTSHPVSAVAVGRQTENTSCSLLQRVARPISGYCKRLKGPGEEPETFPHS